MAAKWLIQEEGSELAERLQASGAILLAPQLVLAEVGNVGWKKLRLGELSPEHMEALAGLATWFDRLTGLQDHLRRALAIARELDSPVSDCFYLALAEAEEATLVTDDRRLLRRLEGTPWKGRVLQLADVAVPEERSAEAGDEEPPPET